MQVAPLDIWCSGEGSCLVRRSKASRYLQWFERGAAAFAACRSDVPETGVEAIQYVCPECVQSTGEAGMLRARLFDAAALESGELTVEHVPPARFGGRKLVLTCKFHNNTAGTALEAHAGRRENPIDAMLGTAKASSRVRLTSGGQSIPAELKREGRDLICDLPSAASGASFRQAQIRRFAKP